MKQSEILKRLKAISEAITENSIDEIRNKESYKNVKKGCEVNSPTDHCKNCSYKELSPMLKYLGV